MNFDEEYRRKKVLETLAQIDAAEKNTISGINSSPNAASSKTPEWNAIDKAEKDTVSGINNPKSEFDDWYAKQAKEKNIDPNPDNPEHHYDYRGFYEALKKGEVADPSGKDNHFDSRFKTAGHPREYMSDSKGRLFDTKSGNYIDDNKPVDRRELVKAMALDPSDLDSSSQAKALKDIKVEYPTPKQPNLERSSQDIEFPELSEEFKRRKAARQILKLKEPELSPGLEAKLARHGRQELTDADVAELKKAYPTDPERDADIKANPYANSSALTPKQFRNQYVNYNARYAALNGDNRVASNDNINPNADPNSAEYKTGVAYEMKPEESMLNTDGSLRAPGQSDTRSKGAVRQDALPPPPEVPKALTPEELKAEWSKVGQFDAKGNKIGAGTNERQRTGVTVGGSSEKQVSPALAKDPYAPSPLLSNELSKYKGEEAHVLTPDEMRTALKLHANGAVKLDDDTIDDYTEKLGQSYKSTSVPGMKDVIKTRMDDLNKTFDSQYGTAGELADIETKQASKKEEVWNKYLEGEKAREAEFQKAEELRRKENEIGMQRINNSIDDVSKFEPANYWSNGGNLLGGIIMGLGAAISARNLNAPNHAMQMLNRSIDDWNDKEKMRYQKLRDKTQMSESAYGYLRQKLGDERQADLALKISAYDRVQKELEGMALETGTAKAKANAKQMSLLIDNERSKAMYDLGKEYNSVKTPGSGTGGDAGTVDTGLTVTLADGTRATFGGQDEANDARKKLLVSNEALRNLNLLKTILDQPEYVLTVDDGANVNNATHALKNALAKTISGDVGSIQPSEREAAEEWLNAPTWKRDNTDLWGGRMASLHALIRMYEEKQNDIKRGALETQRGIDSKGKVKDKVTGKAVPTKDTTPLPELRK